MIRNISLNLPQGIAELIPTVVSENSLAVAYAKSSFLLQGVNNIVGTQQNLLGWVVLGLLMWGCSDTKPPSSNTPVSNDSDGDNIPDDKDRCPVRAAATRDGCPITDPYVDPSAIDTDGDGIPDVSDECPNDSHPSLDPEANGCSPLDKPDGGLSPPMPDPRPPSPWQLLADNSVILQQEDDPVCPHLVGNSEQAILGWQEGSRFLISLVDVPSLGIGEAQSVGPVADKVVNACQLTRALAISGEGSIAVLLLTEEDDNWVQLQIQIKDTDGNNREPQKIVSFPIPHLGRERRDTIASVAALENGRFVVIWTDRDKVLAKIINLDGTFVSEDPFLINRRALDVLQVSNPDVLATADGFKVIWQEGNAAFGNVAYSSFDVNGEKIGDDQLLNIDDTPARWPWLSGEADKVAVAWISPVVGSVQSVSEEGIRRFLSFAPNAEEAGIEAAYYSPQLLLDAQDRAVLAWVEQYRNSESILRLYSHSNVSRLPGDTEASGDRVSNIPADGKISLTQQGDVALLAYPILQPPRSMMLKSLKWVRGEQ